MKIKILFITLLTGFSFLFSGCSFKDVEMGNIEGIELLKVSKDGVDFNVMIPITNNNKYAFTIRKVNLIINSKSGSRIATITGKKKYPAETQQQRNLPF